MKHSTSSTQLTIATLNVLHALVPLSWPIIQATRRYREIGRIMLESPASVFCLNEVTQFFLDIVQPIVNEKYPHSTQLVLRSRKHGVKIYSRLPFEEMLVTDWLAIVRVDVDYKESVVVAATHLSHDERQATKRAKELQWIRSDL